MNNFRKFFGLTFGLISTVGLYASEKVVSTTNIVEGVPTKATVVSCQMRTSDPTVLDVVYNVESKEPFIRVRALAFKEGKRDFGHVIRPETWVDGTEKNLGDHVAANVNHTLSWKVTADWKTDVGNLSFEVLTMSSATNIFAVPYQVRKETHTGELRYYVLTPQVYAYYDWVDNKGVAHMSLSNQWSGESTWLNGGSSDPERLNVLFWFFADKDPQLVLNDGKLKWSFSGDLLPIVNQKEFVVDYWYDDDCVDHDDIILDPWYSTGDEYLYLSDNWSHYYDGGVSHEAYATIISGRLVFNKYLRSKFKELKDVHWKTWPISYEYWD